MQGKNKLADYNQPHVNIFFISELPGGMQTSSPQEMTQDDWITRVQQYGQPLADASAELRNDEVVTAALLQDGWMLKWKNPC